MASSDTRHSWNGWETEVSSSSWWPQGMEWRGNYFARWRWAFRNRGWVVRNNQRLWRSLNRIFRWPLASLLTVGISHKRPLTFRKTKMGCEIAGSPRKNFRRWIWCCEIFANGFGCCEIFASDFLPCKMLYFSSVLEFPCIWSSKIKLNHNKIKLK